MKSFARLARIRTQGACLCLGLCRSRGQDVTVIGVISLSKLSASESAAMKLSKADLRVPFGTKDHLALFTGVAQPHGQRADHEVAGACSNVRSTTYARAM